MPHRRPSRSSHRRPDRSADRLAERSASHPADRRPSGGSQGRAGGPGGGLAGPYGVEALEERRMLTTFSGSGQFQYADGTGKDVIIVYNDVTFEAIADAGGTAGNLIPFPLPPNETGENLFKIYVSTSNVDSSIAITTFDPTSGHFLPYAGSVGGFRVTNTAGVFPSTISIPAGTGGVLLGDEDTLTDPITSITLLNSFGVQPAPESGMLTAGIEVAATDPATDLPNNFGNFLVGGTVLGQVYFGGNVNEFYAGAVLTGNANGGTIEAGVSAPLAPAIPSTGAAPGVTGATGTTAATPPSFANFSVAGDLREFITNGPVGTDGAGPAGDPNYASDFAMTVGGQLGEMHVGNQISGAGTVGLAGSVVVSHNANIASGIAPTVTVGGTTEPAPLFDPGTFTPTEEVETLSANYVGAEFGAANPATGLPGVYFRNDTLDTAQVLSPTPVVSATTGLPTTDSAGDINYEAEVIGELQGTVTGVGTDTIDDYAMAFQAGQVFTVATTAPTLFVYDPDGRLIASNDEAGGGPLQVDADRPGLYRFEVTEPTVADTPYTLTITGTGDMGIGGVVVDGYYSDAGFNGGLVADRGDIGTVEAFGELASQTTGPTPANDPGLPADAPTTIGVYAGSLRSVYGGQIGQRSTGNPAILVDGPYLNVPFGGVGLVRTTVAGGVLDLETQYDPADRALPTPEYVTDDATATAIGGNIQVIDAAGTFQTELFVNGGVGTIHAADWATDQPSYVDVNADNKGNDGIIDLIDTAGSFGDSVGGGPEFVTNDGGYIRYMVLTGPVFRDSQFGTGIVEPIVGTFDQTMSFVDQAGNRVTVVPFGPVTDGTTTATTTGSTTTTTTTGTSSTTTAATAGPVLTMLLYPIRDKSGEVPIAISSTGSLEIAAAGSAGNNSAVNIGTVSVTGTGRAIVSTGVTDRYGNTTISQQSAAGTNTAATAGTVALNGTSVTGTVLPVNGANGVTDATDEFLLLTGPATINVMNVVVAAGSAVAIQNTTKGEIATLLAPNVGTIQTVGNLGFTTPVATPAAVLPETIIPNGNVYPFVQQHTGVVIGTGIALGPVGDVPGTGDAVSILVGGGVGNVQVGGILQTLIANFGGGAPPGQVDGIDGPIVATEILNTDIGQGIAFNGTGTVGFSGLYATNTIGSVSNNNNTDSNIRGPIVSGDLGTGQQINYVQLVNGSVIDTRIGTVFDANFSEVADPNLDTLQIPGDTVASPFTAGYTYAVGAVSVSGLGGIIGSEIEAGSVGQTIVANGGFGILYSTVGATGAGRVGTVIASGYGIRDSTVGNGDYLGPVTASGNGSLLPTSVYPIDVRESDVGSTVLDPATGMTPDLDTDINAALGVTGAAAPSPDVEDTGVIEDDTIIAQQDFAGLTARIVRTALPPLSTNTNTTDSLPNIPVYAVPFADSINVGGTIGLIRVYDIVDGLQVAAGHLHKVLISNDVSRLGIAVAGPIDSIVVHGNLGQTYVDPTTGDNLPDSYVMANGPAGTLTSLTTYGSLFANVVATGRIGTMNIMGDIEGSITAQGNVTNTNPRNKQFLSVGTLRVAGGIRDGSLAITGSVGNLIINGGLGTTGGTLAIGGSVNQISVGADRKRKGSQLGLALTVTGNVQQLSVYGSITGSVDVTGDLRSLAVTDDGSTPNAIAGPVSVGGRLYNATVTNGNVNAPVTVGGDLYDLTVNHGNITAGTVVSDTLGSIHNLRVLGGAAYGIAGSVLAPSGTGLSVTTTGNLAGTLSALSGNTISIGGSILTDAKVSIAATLEDLVVGGSIDGGASVVGHPIRHSRVRGTTAPGTVS